MIKKVIYRNADGQRETKSFDVGGVRMCDGIRIDKEKEGEVWEFIKTVDYLASVYEN
ncbi:hypothetical protein OAF54_03725 [bacterium]|nr:hypothetical protein [bacterium]